MLRTTHNLSGILLLVLILFNCSCRTGYQKQHGGWVWVSYDESAGKRVTPLGLADKKSFHVLENSDYAKDHKRVYYRGGPILGAKPSTFEIIGEDGYAKDDKHVFLEWSKVIHADPASFEVLGFPYARDSNTIFCGTLPLPLDKREMESFVVKNEEKLMANSRTTILLSHFIETNPAYAWLDTLHEKFVIVGNQGSGETKTKKVKGYSIFPK